MHVMKFAKNYPHMEIYFHDKALLLLNHGKLNDKPKWWSSEGWDSKEVWRLEDLEEIFDMWGFEGMIEPTYEYTSQDLKECNITFEECKLPGFEQVGGVIMKATTKKGKVFKQYIEVMKMQNLNFDACIWSCKND